MLEAIFRQLLAEEKATPAFADDYWQALVKAYAHKSRHYHTLEHLRKMWHELEEVRSEINDWPSVVWALFYHDAIYNSLRQDNEQRSAELAVKHMRALNIAAERVDKCKDLILATKLHAPAEDADTNFFTDADLAILGQSPEEYDRYAQQVRKEYQIYPDVVYLPGRKKVLGHFLEMSQLYQTPHFREKYEQKARENMARELLSLS